MRLSPSNTGFRPARLACAGLLAVGWLTVAAAGPGAPVAARNDPGGSPPWPRLRLSAASVETGELRLDGARFELAPDGAATLRFERLAATDGEAWLEATELAGRLDRLDTGEAAFDAAGEVTAWGLQAAWALHSAGDALAVRLDASRQPVAALAGLPWTPGQLGWIQAGRFDAVLGLELPEQGGASWTLEGAVSGLGFDSPDGRYARQDLVFDWQARGALGAPGTIAAGGRLRRGELLIDRLYRAFDGAPLEWGVEGPAGGPIALRLSDPGALRIDAEVSWDALQAERIVVEVETLALEFPGAWQRYLDPLAAAWDLDGLEVTGRASWRGAWRAGELESGDLDIEDLSVVDTRRGRFALTGLDTVLRPGDRAFESRFSWRGLLLGKINLGAGQAVLGSEPGLISLASPLVLDVMGGRLRLDAFRYALPGARPAAGRDTFLSARLVDIELEPLTTALGWPVFGGRMNGDLPGARLEDGVLSVDGSIRVEVFGGEVSISDLRIERPFGVLPSLAANVEVGNLDLERLTETFSFGRIGGRVDGYVHDLRMLDWEPVAFDAWLGTPQRQRSNNAISRQAVKHLTSIGGGGPTAALSGPLLRFFNDFSYRRVGLGCTLANHVCTIRGLSDDGQGVLLLEGAGVPRITIRAYNRQIDWPQMVANLKAVSEGESIEFGSGSKP